MSVPRPVAVLVLGAALASAVPGCRRQAEPAPAPTGPSSTAAAGPAHLTLTADRDTMRTVDRLTVTLEAVGDPGVRLDAPDFDPSEAGWTLVSRLDDPPRADAHGRAVLTSTITLEPFLEGEYTLPPATLAFTPAQGQPSTLSTEPLSISVASVLDPEDPAELSEPAAMLAAPPPPEPQSGLGIAPWLIAGAAAVAAVGIGVALRRRTPRPITTPVDDLRRLLSLAEVEPDAAYAAIARALNTHPAPGPEARALADEADRVRYGRAPASPQRAAAAVREALDLLTRGGSA
jgi:hypothetical protein